MIYADTSFIASAYGLDANTATARRFVETNHCSRDEMEFAQTSFWLQLRKQDHVADAFLAVSEMLNDLNVYWTSFRVRTFPRACRGQHPQFVNPACRAV
jgi:hypothetical protein